MNDDRSLPPALGNYAAGERFWDRESEVAELAGYLADGQSILLTGPRRVGKTSVVHATLAKLEPRMRTLFVDVEDARDPAELFSALAAAASGDACFWGKLREWFGKRLGQVAERIDGINLGAIKVDLQAAMAGSWRDDARAVVAALADRPTVVAVDELPLLANRLAGRDVAELELLMGLLRHLSEEFRQVRWLVSGSIGLEPVLHRVGLTGTVTHLRPYTIDAWDLPTTTAAVTALALGHGLSLGPGAAEAAYEVLGLGVPYHVQVLVDEIWRDSKHRDDPAVTSEDVRRVYSGPFLSSALRAHLLHLETRLQIVLGEGDSLRLALDLLTQAAVEEPMTVGDAGLLAEDLIGDSGVRPAILREVLDILEHDAYLSRGPDGWRYRSRLVRDWWRQRNELGFIPARRRGKPEPA